MITSNPFVKKTLNGVQLIFQFSFEPIDHDGSFYSGVKDNHYRSIIFECNTPNYTISSTKPESVSTNPKDFKMSKKKTASGIITIIDFDNFHFEAGQDLNPLSYEKAIL
jgi:hypothetical protein|tara:strand:+ start:306 stop:632 length:327 start_codon:yes stop_codon:yes gene_type:complete